MHTKPLYFQMQPQYVSTITTTTVASGPPSYDKLEQPPPTYDETGLRVNIPGNSCISLGAILK